MAAELTLLVYAFPLMIAGMALPVVLTPQAVAYRAGLMRVRREDLPDHPVATDFETAVPPIAPGAALQTRLIWLSIAALGLAAFAWLTLNHANEIIDDLLNAHDLKSPRMLAFVRGLAWAPLFLMSVAAILLVWSLAQAWRRRRR